jgi:hypothetical protein
MQFRFLTISDRSALVLLSGLPLPTQETFYQGVNGQYPITIESLSEGQHVLGAPIGYSICRITSPDCTLNTSGAIVYRDNTPPPPPVVSVPVAQIIRWELVDRDADAGWSIVELWTPMGAGDKLLLSDRDFHAFIDFEHVKNRRYRIDRCIGGSGNFMRYPIGCASNPAPKAKADRA